MKKMFVLLSAVLLVAALFPVSAFARGRGGSWSGSRAASRRARYAAENIAPEGYCYEGYAGGCGGYGYERGAGYGCGRYR